jgi:hypothetical protein
MRKLIPCALLILLAALPAAGTNQQDAAADSVAAAFAQARQAAHLPKLERMSGNKFREKVCKQDMRFASGLIKIVRYETFDPAQIPESAQRLAKETYQTTTPARFGVGVCVATDSPANQPKYSVLIATYESRSASFWRTFD